MKSATDYVPSQLVRKKVAFKDDDEHRECWHLQAGLHTGVVLRVARTLAQKAEMVRDEGLTLPDDLLDSDEPVRVWVKADPSPSFPRGCEAAVEIECLWVIDE